MSYFFRLKNNESIELSALEVENGTYALTRKMAVQFFICLFFIRQTAHQSSADSGYLCRVQ